MPNSFSPKPGSSWRKPSPRSPHAEPQHTPLRGYVLAEEQAWRDTQPFEPVDRFGLTETDKSWLTLIAGLVGLGLALAIIALLWDRATFNEGQACRERLAAQNATQEQIARICGPRSKGGLL